MPLRRHVKGGGPLVLADGDLGQWARKSLFQQRLVLRRVRLTPEDMHCRVFATERLPFGLWSDADVKDFDKAGELCVVYKAKVIINEQKAKTLVLQSNTFKLSGERETKQS